MPIARHFTLFHYKSSFLFIFFSSCFLSFLFILPLLYSIFFFFCYYVNFYRFLYLFLYFNIFVLINFSFHFFGGSNLFISTVFFTDKILGIFSNGLLFPLHKDTLSSIKALRFLMIKMKITHRHREI